MTHTKVLHFFLGSLCLLASQTFAALVIDEGLDNAGIDSGINDTSYAGKAANFVMGAGDDYTLSSVVLGLSETSGSSPKIQLWSDDGTSAPIGTLLETLSNPASLVDGANTFTSSGTTLSASATYWIVVDANTSTTFKWLGNNADTSVTSDIGATHTARVYAVGEASPGDWDSSSSVLNQIQVYATVIPEPSALLLTALAGCAVLLVGRRRR